MSNILLILDTREKHLIEYLTGKVEFTVEQLAVGDIIIREEGSDILTIERKTVEDLKASICDSRHREQKARLLSTVEKTRIVYLIEGNLDLSLTSNIGSKFPVSTLIGSLINTMFRDNIKVYKTSSLKESGEFLIKLIDKFRKDGDNYFRDNTNSTEGYISTLQKTKKANMTPELWYKLSLCQIPGLTEKVANVIVEKYPTILSLINEYEKTPEHLREKLVSDMKFDIQGDKKRRIGDSLSKKVYGFVYNL